jgi:hypothetical protein
VPMGLRLYSTGVLLLTAGVIYLTNSSILVLPPGLGPDTACTSRDGSNVRSNRCDCGDLHGEPHASADP